MSTIQNGFLIVLRVMLRHVHTFSKLGPESPRLDFLQKSYVFLSSIHLNIYILYQFNISILHINLV